MPASVTSRANVSRVALAMVACLLTIVATARAETLGCPLGLAIGAGVTIVFGCLADDFTCVVKGTNPTHGWAPGCINGSSDFGGWSSCQACAVLDKGYFDLSGTVSAPGRADPHVSGSSVVARGPGGIHRMSTDAKGNYALALKRGTYTGRSPILGARCGSLSVLARAGRCA